MGVGGSPECPYSQPETGTILHNFARVPLSFQQPEHAFLFCRNKRTFQVSFLSFQALFSLFPSVGRRFWRTIIFWTAVYDNINKFLDGDVKDRSNWGAKSDAERDETLAVAIDVCVQDLQEQVGNRAEVDRSLILRHLQQQFPEFVDVTSAFRRLHPALPLDADPHPAPFGRRN